VFQPVLKPLKLLQPHKVLNGTPDTGTAMLLFAGKVTVSGSLHLTEASSVCKALTVLAIGAV
jgi:hypothetical protein